MARYIDAEALIKYLDDNKYAKPCNDFQRGVNASVDWLATEIKTFPTTDVVPKSEVDKWKQKAEELSEVLSDTIRIRYSEAKVEVAREIFEEIWKIVDDCNIVEKFKEPHFNLSGFVFGLAELKKKFVPDTNVGHKTESEGNP